MNNKTMKILIVLGVFVAFSFISQSAFADYYIPYEYNNNNDDACFISSFTANNTNINQGDSVRLNWSTDSCADVQITNLGNVRDIGSAYVYPEGDTIYKITAYNFSSNKYTKTINVYVNNNNSESLISNNSSTKPGTTIVNNYYTTAPANTSRVATTTNTSNTSTTKNNTTNTNTNTTKSTPNDTNTDKSTTDSTTKNTDGVYGGATDVTGGDLTALSLKGSGSFMPSSIWQWILVIFLILIVIILVRIVSKPPRPKIQEVHA